MTLPKSLYASELEKTGKVEAETPKWMEVFFFSHQSLAERSRDDVRQRPLTADRRAEPAPGRRATPLSVRLRLCHAVGHGDRQLPLHEFNSIGHITIQPVGR